MTLFGERGCVVVGVGVLRVETMSLQLIYVLPVAGGWMTTSALLAGPLMFRAGARAEEQARRLAAAVASGGAVAWVIVKDRLGAEVARVRYGPRIADRAPPGRPCADPSLAETVLSFA
jgi:hypothetical protein